MTLSEIIKTYNNYSIYQLDANTTTEMIAVVDSNGYVYLTFDGTQNNYTVYSTDYDNVKFSEVAYLWADTVAKIILWK